MSTRRPNVLLIVLDSVKAKNTGLLGYERETTPFLDSFAGSSSTTTYTAARAPGMRSYPSHVSMFTGLEVAEHGAHALRTHKIDPSSTIWHTLSTEHEYSTGVFSDNVNLTSENSLVTSFDHVVGRRGRLIPNAPDPDKFFNSPKYRDHGSGRSKYAEYAKHCLRSAAPFGGLANGGAKFLARTIPSSRLEQRLDHSAERYLDPFYDWIDSVDRPWAACINLMDTHLPFFPDKEHDLWGGSSLQREQSKINPTAWNVYGGDVSWDFWSSLEDLYDGTIRQVDRYLEELIDHLRTTNDFEDTLLVITADHGEGFGEYSRVKPDLKIAGHIVGLHESLVHVPLIVSTPGQSENAMITELATLRRFPDVVMASLMGEVTTDAFVPNGPVVAMASTIDTRQDEQSVRTVCDDLTPFTGDVRAVYRSENGITNKFLTWDDRGVTIEISDAQDARAVDHGDPHEMVTATFEEFDDSGIVTEQESISDETKAQLKSLGYL